jgi:hypothetical protein
MKGFSLGDEAGRFLGEGVRWDSVVVTSLASEQMKDLTYNHEAGCPQMSKP